KDGIEVVLTGKELHPHEDSAEPNTDGYSSSTESQTEFEEEKLAIPSYKASMYNLDSFDIRAGDISVSEWTNSYSWTSNFPSDWQEPDSNVPEWVTNNQQSHRRTEALDQLDGNKISRQDAATTVYASTRLKITAGPVPGMDNKELGP